MTGHLPANVGRFAALLALATGAILTETVAVSAAVLVGGWVAGPPMAGTRDSHTVTVLKDGRVLVVGGGAEIYDPTANRWSQAGTPLMARTSATATLLTGGRVLVVAGIVGEHSVINAEIYDPTRNTWTAAASMAGRRYAHTATLLADGRVLVAGGTRTTVTLDSAEIYDPKSDAWSAAASLPAPRTGHTATLLPDGRVLVAGGTNGSGVLATAAIYDPAANKWAPGPSMTMPRRGSLSTRLRDGRILVVGGLEFPGPAQVAAEIFEPKTESWSPAGQATQPLVRDGFAMTILKDGRVLICGGAGPPPLAIGATAGYIYDPQRDRWSASAYMRQGRVDHSASLLPNGRVLVAGGRDAFVNGTPLNTTEIFDVSTVTNTPATTEATTAQLTSATPGVSLAGGRLPLQQVAWLVAGAMVAGGVLILAVVLFATTLRRFRRL